MSSHASHIVPFDELPRRGDASVFEGEDFDASVSFFLTDLTPGDGPDMHLHPYDEVFVVQEGHATFFVGDARIEVPSGNIVVGPAGVPHRFLNSGPGRLRTVNIHPAPRIETQWLDEQVPEPG